jgi:autotransporter-associated beta strand protein
MLALALCVLMLHGAEAIGANFVALSGGSWTNTSVWGTNGALPGAGDVVFIRNGRTVSIDAPVGSVADFLLGATGDSTGSLMLYGNGRLVAGTGSVGRNQNGAVGYLHLRAGAALQMGNTNGSGVLNVGVETSTNRCLGVMTVRGGIFSGRLVVGSDLAGASGDVVRILGSGSTIGSGLTSSNNLVVNSSGSLEFIFDRSGVSTLDFAGPALFSAAAKVVVDGSFYRGPAQTFELLRAGSFGPTAPQITLRNFAPGASHAWQNGALTVSVTGPSPELPTTPLPSVVSVYRLDRANSSLDEMMASVAGIVNRNLPGRLLPDAREAWLDRLREEYPSVLKDAGSASDYFRFIDQHFELFSGYIIYDKDANPESLDVATSVAGVEQAIIVDPSTVSYALAAGLPLILDARDKTQQWAWDNYHDRFSRTKMFHLATSGGTNRLTGFTLRDYAVMTGGFCYYLPSDMGFYPRGQSPGGLLYGWGLERPFFSAASTNNQQAVAADLLVGASGTSGWKVDIKPQKNHVPLDAQPVDGNHYVAFVVSDGDNVGILQGNWITTERLFASPLRGRFKITWDISPALAEINPFGLNYIYGQAGIDKFVNAGGRGLFFPGEVPDLPALAADVDHAMREVDQNVISILDPSLDMSVADRIVSAPQVLGVMYKTYDGAYKALNGQIRWSGGKPIISVKHTLWEGFGTPASISAALNAAPRNPRFDQNSYSIVNVHPWSPTPVENLDALVQQLNENVKVVSLEELIIYLRNAYGVNQGFRAAREVCYWTQTNNLSQEQRVAGVWESPSIWNTQADGAGASSDWKTNHVAAFRPGNYAVAVQGAPRVSGLEFQGGEVKLAGGALDITGETEVRVPAGVHEIGSRVQGVGHLRKTGAGTLLLSHPDNVFTGRLTVADGTVRLTGTLAKASGVVIEAGAVLDNQGIIASGDVSVGEGGTYLGRGEVTGSLTNRGTVRAAGGQVLGVRGIVTNFGLLDLMTSGQGAPGNLVNLGGRVLLRDALRVANFQKLPNGFQVVVESYGGHNYRLQRSMDLVSPWQDVGPDQAGVTMPGFLPKFLTFEDQTAPDSGCFYRIVVTP